jgi:hypothetical protein
LSFDTVNLHRLTEAGAPYSSIVNSSSHDFAALNVVSTHHESADKSNRFAAPCFEGEDPLV